MTPVDTASHLTEARIQLLLDDALDPEAARQARDHLRRCPACRRRLEAQVALFAAIESWPDSPAPAHLPERVMARIAPPPPPVGLRLATALQAVLAVLVGIAAWPLAGDLLRSVRLPESSIAWPGMVEAAATALAVSVSSVAAEIVEAAAEAQGWLGRTPSQTAWWPAVALAVALLAALANSILLRTRNGVAEARR